MTSSITAFGVPYYICRQECFLQLDDQCMEDCAKERDKRLLSSSPTTMVDNKMWPFMVGSGALFAIGCGLVYYSTTV